MASGQERSPNPTPDFNRLSEEEKKVLKECSDESFYRRALPLSLGAIVGVQYLVRTGKLARHPSYGALPKSIIAGGLAFIFGKASYLQECRNKILEQIPNSSLATAIKKGRSHGQPDTRIGQTDEFPSSESGNNRNSGIAYPVNPRSFEGLSDSERPSMDNEVNSPDAPEEKKSMTYEDLRKKNREEYKDRLNKPSLPPQPQPPSYKDSPYMPQKVWPDNPTPSQDRPRMEDTPAPKRKRTNIWGDVIDE